MSVHSEIKKVTTETLRKMKFDKEKITMLTAYDYTTAKMVDAGGVDAILIGDSAANVMAGHETTLPITLDQMIYHAQCVVRGVDRALVVADLPFGTYQSDPQKALESGVRMMKESGAHAVKIEGGEEIADSVSRLINAGIPVMGHLGLTPQSIYQPSFTCNWDWDFSRLSICTTSIEKNLCLGRTNCFAYHHSND